MNRTCFFFRNVFITMAVQNRLLHIIMLQIIVYSKQVPTISVKFITAIICITHPTSNVKKLITVHDGFYISFI